MKNIKIIRITIFIFFFCWYIQEKAIGQSNQFEDWIESILANADEDYELDLNTILEQFYYYEEHPLDLNKATREELLDLFFLTDLDIESIINHRVNYGDFINILELQSVHGLSLEKIRLLGMLSTVKINLSSQFDKNTLKDQKNELYLKWRRTIEDQKGYSPENSNPYLGDPNKLYIRYKYVAGRKIQIGFTAEKDSGEEFFKGSNKSGFDFYSGHVNINQPTNKINRIIIGDYSVSLGQGLIAAMGFGTGKSTQIMNVKNKSKTLKPYTSVNEFNFLRGGALDFTINKSLNFNIFGSYQKRDANFFIDTINNNILRLYTSVPIDGFHRNANEIRKEKQLNFIDAGASLKFDYNRLNINANVLYSGFNNVFNTNPQLYQIFYVLQKEYFNGSIDYNYIWRNFNFFGEIASDRNFDLATVNGLILGLDKNLEIAIVYRNISRSYQSLYGNAFTESSTAQNEEGIYASALLRLNKKMQLQGYADFFRHPWLKFRIDSPSNGQEYYLKFLYTQKRKLDFYIQYFYEQKEQNLTNESVKTTRVVPTYRQRLRFHQKYVVNPNFEIRNRVDFSWFKKDQGVSRGFMVYQDIIYKPKNSPLSATMRYALFDTDDYNSRIYAYENDLLYEFSIPAYANRGFRTYLNLRYRVNGNLTAEARIARTYLNDQKTIGSANDEINGNTRTDVKMQLRFKF